MDAQNAQLLNERGINEQLKAIGVTAATLAVVLVTAQPAAAAPAHDTAPPAAVALAAGPAAAAAGPTYFISNCDGRGEHFRRADNRSVEHRWQSVPGGSYGAWANIGGVVHDDIAVARNNDCRLEVFIVGTDFQLWHKWQDSASPNGWSGWAALGADFRGTPSLYIYDSAGWLEVCAWYQGWDFRCKHQDPASPNGWSGWY